KNIHNEIQVLKSKSLMKRVLTELDLFASFYKEGEIKTTEIYGKNLPIKVIVHELDSSAFGLDFNLFFNGGNSFKLQEGESPKTTAHQFGKEIRKPYGRFTIIANLGANKANREKSIKIRLHNINNL